MKQPSVLAALVLGAVPALAVPALYGPGPGGAWRAASEELMKDRDQEKLGELIQVWLEARAGTNTRTTTVEAREEVQAELDKWAKKLDERAPLSATADLGKALWYSKQYDKAKGVKKGKVADVETRTGGGSPREIEYALWAPSGYKASAGPYPLVLTIPDAGEKPSDHLTQHWTLGELKDGAVLAAVPMPENVEAWRTMEGLANFFAVFLDVTSTYAVDFDRIFVAGRGRGVEMAAFLAGSFPDRFAGLIGRSGDVGDLRAENFRNLPSLLAGAGGKATAFAEACKQNGHENVQLAAEGKEEDVWAWMKGTSRDSNPAEVVLLPGSPIPNKAYWVEVPPFDNADGKASLRARVDRAENKITVEVKGGIRQVTLFYNDELVDLDRPVKVVLNGAEHEDLIQRGLTDLLETFRTTRSDPGKLYLASMTYDVPAGAAESTGGTGSSGQE